MDPKSRVSDIYEFLIIRKLIKRIRNCSFKEFEYYSDEISLWAEDGTTPLQFQRVRIDFSSKLASIKDSPILMIKRTYFDDLMDDNTLLTKNKSKLAVIKSLDESMAPERPALTDEGAVEYSPAAAKIYELFPCIYEDSRYPRSSALVGIDYNFVYIVDRDPDANEQETATRRGVGAQVVTPRFAISSIQNYSIVNDQLIIRSISTQNSEYIQIFIESNFIRQIYNKLDFILRKLRGYPAPAG